MAKHIFKKNGPPDFIPRESGHHFVDLIAKETYISVGTTSVSDWIILNEASVIPVTKSGIVANTSFTGSPKTYPVVFSTAFSTTDYSISIRGIDNRSWSYESKSVSGFTINANAAAELAGEVSFFCSQTGESA